MMQGSSCLRMILVDHLTYFSTTRTATLQEGSMYEILGVPQDEEHNQA